MSTRASAIFTVASVTLLGGLVAYAVYFDYKRRNDVEFRKKLRKEKKRAGKTAAQTQGPSGATLEVSQDDLRAAMVKLKDEPLPQTPEEKEHYFMSQVNLGEQLCGQGPAFHLAAALSFYRALRVYPSPVELIVIYQKTVPEPVFKLVMELTNMDVSSSPSSPRSTAPASVASEGQNASSEEDETSPSRSGPPSETSSQEWDKLTDPGNEATTPI
ncbi:hypothetical protein NLI96_g2585 [Meripilus lineatus]|uniref:Mitochondrial import receptor subunit TOM20 n=1 Tax=Meripilus lineatus TaxID=2056292 RepID=A0AAD5VD01_9APHY|nr:hypothetical protein NLI96_g2585 [Physisporinus lineatus]